MEEKMSNEENSLKHNQRALKHGGEGAVRHIKEGTPFIGQAADEERAVSDELEAMGITELVRRDAIRLQTAMNLYWTAVLTAAQEGDLPALDRYIARFGWLGGVTLRALAQLQADEKARAKTAAGIVDVMEAIRKATDDNQDR